MKSKIVIALVVLNAIIWSFAANAGNIIVSTVSHHTGTFDYNNNNFGLGYEEEGDRICWYYVVRKFV